VVSPRADAQAGPEAAQESPENESESLDVIDRILAERRRGDYPEIEAEEFGFTIEERIRISGSTFSTYDEALGLLRQERYEEGIAALEALTQMAPELTVPYIDLGIAYARIADFENAASALETAVRLSPDHPIARNELGMVYRRLGRFDDARTEYENALSVYSEFHFARRNLAVLCDLYLADAACAIENYRAYLESVGEDSDVEIWLADLSVRSGIESVGEEL
jgi:Flp pilus assembly protein TadD